MLGLISSRQANQRVDTQTVLPINKDILKIASDASKPNAKGPEPGLVDKLFREWREYHSIRMSIATVAWGLGMAALLLA